MKLIQDARAQTEPPADADGTGRLGLVVLPVHPANGKIIPKAGCQGHGLVGDMQDPQIRRHKKYALCRHQHLAKDLYERRFATAQGANDGDEPALRHTEVHRFQNASLGISVPEGDVLELQGDGVRTKAEARADTQSGQVVGAALLAGHRPQLLTGGLHRPECCGQVQQLCDLLYRPNRPAHIQQGGEYVPEAVANILDGIDCSQERAYLDAAVYDPVPAN
mmetsp:Transcript_99142/g.280779  ORF Transcript_99142/g.280779 Transcript_99142/m.280779 type:complete len:221 (-) Transcript_99142:1630-2292(-)